MPSSDDRPSTTPAPQAEDRQPMDRRDGWVDRLRQRLGLKPTANIRENLEVVLEENAPALADFSEEERAMLRNILALREQRAGDLAVPRADIYSIQKDTPLGEVMVAFEEAAHSRLIVHDDTLDDPVGMVHIKDLLTHLLSEAKKGSRKRKAKAAAEGAPPPPAAVLDLGLVDLSTPLSAAKIIRPLLFVPPSMPALDLLEKMQATRLQMALVIDEYGGTDGLVTVKDIVEAIVGDIDDEHDADDGPSIAATAENIFVADARASLDEVREAVGPDFAPDEDMSEDVDTLGGYLTALARHVPVRGEVLAGPGGLEFEVIDADPRRVKRVRIHRRAPPAPPEAAEGAPKPAEPPTAESLPPPQVQGAAEARKPAA